MCKNLFGKGGKIMNEVIRKLVLTNEKQFNYLHKKRNAFLDQNKMDEADCVLSTIIKLREINNRWEAK